MSIQLKNNSFVTGRLTVGGSTASSYQLGVDGSIATTSTIAWGMSNLGNSPGFSMGVDATSGYLEIDEVTSGGTLKIDTDNTRIGSGQVYLEGGLTSATPSQYLGRVTGGGGGVMVGRTAAQVLADIGAAPASGGAYLPLAGGTMTGNIVLDDNVQLRVGTDADLRIYHNGANNFLLNAVGNLNIRNTADDGNISFQSDDGSGGYTNYFIVDGGNKQTQVYEDFRFQDDVMAKFGNSSELQIHHDASNSYIQDTGTGNLLITSDGASVQINKGTTENMAEFITDGAVKLYYDSAKKFETTSTGVTVTGAATATTFLGDLNGTINTATTGVTQTAGNNSTKIATTAYADAAAGAVPIGNYLPLAGGTMTGAITDLETTNDLTVGTTGTGQIRVQSSGSTFWQVFKNGSTTYMTTSGSSSDSIFLGAPTTSVTTNLTVSGNIQAGNTGDGSLTLKQSGTTFMQMFKVASSAGSFINTGTGGDTIHFGNTTGLVCNVNVTGFLDADNFKINGSQGTNGQVLTSSGTGVSWQTPTTGTITGSGASKQIAVFDSATGIASYSSLTRPSAGTLYTEIQYQVKPGATNAGYSCTSDTDTGLGDFDGANGVSLISKGNKQITVKENDIKFDPYTATAVSTTGPLNANQSNQAPTQDTLATLAVDPSGNVVRGEQEATFKFTLAQLNSTLGQTLISAPGADKAVVITYTDWMMEYSSTGSVNNQLEIRQANLAQANASVSVLPALRFNEIVNQSQSGSAPFYGFYTRDIPTGSGSQGRTYAVNKATTFHKQTSSPYPNGLTSISIKIRYRIFDVDTF